MLSTARTRTATAPRQPSAMQITEYYAPDVIAAIVDQYGDTVDWSQFDADGDQIIDLLVIIHAGYGFQNGGGEDRLSTSSSSLFPNLIQIGGTTTPETDDDYYVEGFNVDPEQLDVGAIQEEFEHQFGLPDMYSTDANNSNAWWAAHSSGVWGGPLGGTRPVGHNLWQDWVLGWRDPMIIDYDDPQLVTGKLEVDLGRARYTPESTEDGVIIRLPDEGVLVENLAGDGVGWWSDSGDLMDHRVYREFDLITATGTNHFQLRCLLGYRRGLGLRLCRSHHRQLHDHNHPAGSGWNLHRY